MLVALLIFLVVIPIVGDFSLLPETTQRAISYTCLLVVGVWSMRGSGSVFRIGLVLVVAGVVMSILDASPVEGAFDRGSMTAMLLFLVLAVWSSMHQVLFSREINANRVVGAVCVYLLLGSAWAVAYGMVEIIYPGSFMGAALDQVSGQETKWLYFSFVTLTTLGYGDITPVTNTARVLVYAEAIFGVFYMAILVANIVSAYASVHQKQE